MSNGRYTYRGYAFQSFAFRTWTLAGGDGVVITDPCNGWITVTRQRLLTAHTSQRTLITSIRERVWITKGDRDT